jgi:rhodanese-related sulfurtransferase/DNA-binding HxlR family transcriptional regulator
VANPWSKARLYDGFAEVAKALSSGRRLEIVDVLDQGARSVEEIAEQIGQSMANTSHHLRALARAGLVTRSREGTRIYYDLSSEAVANLWVLLRDVALQHVAAVPGHASNYVGARKPSQQITQDELAARLRRKRPKLVVLDVRPAAEYAAGHIRGARSVPVTELRQRLGELPQDTEIVAYCRGPYCVYADQAVRELTRRGFRARRLVDGFPEWRRADLPWDVTEAS